MRHPLNRHTLNRHPLTSRLAPLIPALLISALLAFTSARAQDATPHVEALQEEIARLQEQVESLSRAVTAPSLLTANLYLDAAGFHAMDEAIRAGELDPRYLETVRTTIAAANAVTWPDELHDEVDAFTTTAEVLEAALQEQNSEAAAEAAALAHERQHELARAIFAHLAPHDSDMHDSPEEDAEAAEIPEDAQRFELTIGENGRAVGGAETYRVRRGEPVALTLTSAVPGGLHLHGYDQDWELAGQEVVVAFPAESTGRFPLEFHPAAGGDGVVVGYLEVRP